MAEEKRTDPAKTGTIAQQLVVLLQDQSPETRRRAIQAAMMLLGDQTVEEMRVPADAGSQGSKRDELGELQGLFGKEEKLRPAENAYLCAAYHFARYGNSPFSLGELRDIAGEAGVVLPDRLDKTLKQAGKDGKKFFQLAGRDAYRPTTAASVYFGERWSVRPGKKSKGGSSGTA